MTQLPIEQVQLLLKNSKYNFGYTPIIGYARKPIFEVNWDLFNKNDIYNNYPAKTECFWASSKKDVETIKFGHHEALAQINDFRINIDGSFKYSKENQTGTIFEKDYFYAEYLIPKGSYNLTHLCVKKLPAFENFFEKDNHNKWIITEEKVKQFIQDYGLFFPTEVVFGGKRFIEETVSKTGNFEGEKKSIEAQAKVALGIVDAGVRTANGSNQTDATGTHTRKLVVQSLGGLPEKQGNPEEWLTGLIENPQSCAVIKMTGLQFTYELLEKDLRQEISSFLKTFPEEEQKIEEVKKKMESGRDFLSGEKKESKEVGQVPVKESEVRDIDSYTKEALVLSKQRPIEYKVDDLACGAKRISYFSQTIAHIFIGAAVPFLNLLPIDTPKAATKLLSNKIIVYFDRDGNKCSNEKEAIEKSVR